MLFPAKKQKTKLLLLWNLEITAGSFTGCPVVIKGNTSAFLQLLLNPILNPNLTDKVLLSKGTDKLFLQSVSITNPDKVMKTNTMYLLYIVIHCNK